MQILRLRGDDFFSSECSWGHQSEKDIYCVYVLSRSTDITVTTSGLKDSCCWSKICSEVWVHNTYRLPLRRILRFVFVPSRFGQVPFNRTRQIRCVTNLWETFRPFSFRASYYDNGLSSSTDQNQNVNIVPSNGIFSHLWFCVLETNR